MTHRRIALRPEQLWALAAGCVLLVVLLLGGGYLVRKHLWARDTLDTVDPRYSRLAGMLQNQERLTDIQKRLRANFADYSYGADRDPSDIGNAALQRVRDLATTHGLRVASSQVGAPKEDPDKGFDRIGLELRLEGGWAPMLDLLRELAAVRPAIFTETAQLSASVSAPTGSGPNAVRYQTVTMQLGLFVLRQRPAGS